MKIALIFLSSLFLLFFNWKNPNKEEWVELFNKKNLDGWIVKISGHDLGDNYKNTFKVNKNFLEVDYSGYKNFDGKFGHLYYKDPYSFYRLQMEYKFIGEQVANAPKWAGRNSGVMLHSQSPNFVNVKQDFPVSFEFQYLYGDLKNPVNTGNVCTPGTRIHINGKESIQHVEESNSRLCPKDEWVKAEAIVFGDSLIHHLINGDTVLTYTNLKYDDTFVSKGFNWTAAGVPDSSSWISKNNLPLSSGFIALQAESQPILFRKIRLLNLIGCTDKKANNFKNYYVKSDNSKCIY
jgi:hypothetical protein